jgi:hypothetical protein
MAPVPPMPRALAARALQPLPCAEAVMQTGAGPRALSARRRR